MIPAMMDNRLTVAATANGPAGRARLGQCPRRRRRRQAARGLAVIVGGDGRDVQAAALKEALPLRPAGPTRIHAVRLAVKATAT